MDQSNTLTFVVASKYWNNVIEDTFSKCKSLGINFVWLKHLNSTNGSTSFSIKRDSKELLILDCYSDGNYPEKFLFKALSFLNSSTWYFFICSDEFITYESMSMLNDFKSKLDKRFVYRCNRLWVKLIGRDYFYSTLSTATGSNCDYQYRLFNLKYLKANEEIHTPGFYVKRFKDLEDGVNILHLPWIIESIDDRIKKIKQYEETLTGAGINKLRYYLPELYPDKIHKWQMLSNSSNQELSDFFGV